MITNLSDHPSQAASVIFRRHMDALLKDFPNLRVEMLWVPSHIDIYGNEAVDCSAKEAVTETLVLTQSISWTREQANIDAVTAWRAEWQRTIRKSMAREVLTDLPSDKLTHFHKNFSRHHATHARINQVILGHGFYGAYYRHHTPGKPQGCPCGEVTIQTREHIIVHCPLYENSRHHLCKVSKDLELPILLGTKTGLNAMASCLVETKAFRKMADSDFNIPWNHEAFSFPPIVSNNASNTAADP
jgi:hypothetical protein